MAVVQGMLEEGRSGDWIVMALHLPPAQPGDRRRTQERALLIRAIDSWLAHHHHAVALPDAEDGARGDSICVAFRREQADAAMAFRVFCGRLGLTATLKQFRVRPNRCRRTTPPPAIGLAPERP
ncbi:MAG: hypothetical protein QF578_09025 [Alphaproteobacteria bacterium]|nr:hypothetical protein [Alphaproteobacteria bacterium]MDP6564953.1 hypothetical protein [Alphaproteobacteria bacterium]MDP6811822.1 hypothetical protein [Alphaproteobacteria bacterium]